MRLFKRNARRHDPSQQPLLVAEAGAEPGIVPTTGPEVRASEAGRDGATELRVSRTVVKSEPELAEMVASEPRLNDQRIAVTLTEKGFGTHVAIAAAADSGLREADLDRLLNQLAEPQKRPFSGG